MVWAGISRGGRTDPHIAMRGMMIGLCYRDDILDVYVRPYAGAIGTSSSLWTITLDVVVPGWLRSTSSRRLSSVWAGQHYYTDLNSIERVWKKNKNKNKKFILALKVILLDRLHGIYCSVIQEP